MQIFTHLPKLLRRGCGSFLLLLSLFAHTATAAYQPAYQPEGTPEPFIMNGFYDTPYGMMQIIGFSNTVYYAADGKTVYIGSLIPRDIKTNEMWHRGTIDGDKLIVDASKPVVTLTEDYGTYRFCFGEYYEEDRGWKIKDLVFPIERDASGRIVRLRFDDNEALPQRHIGLCIVDLEGNATPYAECRCLDLQYFDHSTDFTVLPPTATVHPYIYYGSSSFATDFAERGNVAIDGDDYYFDTLLPEITQPQTKATQQTVWIKGTREGNTITLQNDQYLGNALGYYLYYNGVERTGFNELYNNWTIALSDLRLNIDPATDVITVDSPNTFLPGAYTAAGYLYYYTSALRLQPHQADQLLTPSPVSEISLFNQYNDFGVFCLVFRLTNTTPDGQYLNPEHLGYRIYLDDEVYTFRKKDYPNLDRDYTIVPYGYSDRRADEYSDIVCRDIIWNVVNLREDIFSRIGVQAVYTLDGESRVSPIVYVDIDGNTETVYPDGINPATLLPAPNVGTAYDLSGRRTTPSSGHITIEDGRVVLR